jgi:3-oxoacyl-[acyl-carrier protein] reductase
MSIALSGQVALVTGGSRGIGRAIVKALTGRGAAVGLVATSQEGLDAAVADLQRDVAGASLLALRADVRDPHAAGEAVDAVAGRFGGLDVLVNNAGVGSFGPVSSMSVEDWDRTIGTNLSGVFYCCRAAIPHLTARGGGWIINISSLASKNPFVGGGAYCASKAALNAFSEVLMQEVRHDGIRVAHVLPGSVQTGFSGLPNAKSAWALQPEDVAEVVVDLLAHPARSLPSRVEIRPSQPPRRG